MSADSPSPAADVVLTIDGQVERPRRLTLADLAGIDTAYQVPDVSRLVPARQGAAVKLEGLLQLVGVRPGADYLTLHASRDDFHASIPLSAVRDQALLIYRLGDGPLPVEAGGPLRFLIRDPAACRTREVDECASVKFVDRLEITRGRGFDNRPADESEHAALHRRQEEDTDPAAE